MGIPAPPLGLIGIPPSSPSIRKDGGTPLPPPLLGPDWVPPIGGLTHKVKILLSHILRMRVVTTETGGGRGALSHDAVRRIPLSFDAMLGPVHTVQFVTVLQWAARNRSRNQKKTHSVHESLHQRRWSSTCNEMRETRPIMLVRRSDQRRHISAF